MNLDALFGGSYINWENVAESWAKRTVASRLMLFSARRYLQEYKKEPDPERLEILDGGGLSREVSLAFAAAPDPGDEASKLWGEFLDSALSAELEMISYGERPPVLSELRRGLEAAADEAGRETSLGRWFLVRRDALPGSDLPEDPEYLPV